jgi:hypothetical protein
MKPGEAARHLERRLLVHSDELHTASGAHAKRLERWEKWAEEVGLSTGSMSPDQGKKALHHVVADLNLTFGGYARLPWAGRRLGAVQATKHEAGR